jgi:phosphoribosylanthranilate isomerase
MSGDDVELAVRAGADALGFVTEYPIPVPWNIARQRAAELVAAVPPFVTTTAVVGGPVDHILEIARTVRPHFLQLHGDETLEGITRVCNALKNTATKVLKALRIDVDTGQALFAVPDPVAAAHTLAESGIAGLVVDSKTASRPAGTGVTLDWSVIGRITASIGLPVILAGGLTADNVAEAIERVRPYGVDVISGIESAPAVKDGERIRAFVQVVRSARAE